MSNDVPKFALVDYIGPMEPLKPIGFSGSLGAALKRKFPMPVGRKDQAMGYTLVGLAIVGGAGFDPASDAWALATQRSATGELVATTSLYGAAGRKAVDLTTGQAVNDVRRSNTQTRLVGTYLFSDETGSPRVALSRKPRYKVDEVPTSLTVVWPQGRVDQAKAVGEYNWQWGIVAIGVVVLGFGLWMRRPEKPPIVRPELPPSRNGQSP